MRRMVQYYQKVLALNPIAYWMLDEKSGTVAYDLVSGRVAGAQNSVYTGVTLGYPGIGDGRTTPLYDGTNDYTNIHSATFAAGFNGGEGTALICARVANAGVWTDGGPRVMSILRVNSSNVLQLEKRNVNDQIRALYIAGGTTKSVTTAFSSTDWFCYVCTWSSTADQFIVYLNGVRVGAIQTGLGVWAGVPSLALLGAASVVPVSLWSGTLAHFTVWDRPLSAEEIAGLYDAAPIHIQPTYAAKVLSTRAANLIAYWPQWEAAGAVAQEQAVGSARDGTYVGVTLGQTGIGDGNTCPLFDGANDSNDVDTAALVAAFDGDQGTIMAWLRVSGVGVWTDAANRYAISFIRDGSNYIFLQKSSVANQFGWYYSAGGVLEAVVLGGMVDVDWMCMVLTWDVAAGATGEFRGFYNGLQVGTTQVGLGTWAGALVTATIGAYNLAPSGVTDGYLAHVAVWDVALTPAEIANLKVIP